MEKIYFNHKEATLLGMALAAMIEDLQETTKGSLALKPWSPESRKEFNEMIVNAKSAANKLEKFAGIKCTLPEYREGDEQGFFTKES